MPGQCWRELEFAALRRIKQASGRMSQVQIRLLKDGADLLSLAERERILEAEQYVVDQAHQRFLEWLARVATQ